MRSPHEAKPPSPTGRCSSRCMAAPPRALGLSSTAGATEVGVNVAAPRSTFPRQGAGGAPREPARLGARVPRLEHASSRGRGPTTSGRSTSTQVLLRAAGGHEDRRRRRGRRRRGPTAARARPADAAGRRRRLRRLPQLPRQRLPRPRHRLGDLERGGQRPAGGPARPPSTSRLAEGRLPGDQVGRPEGDGDRSAA